MARQPKRTIAERAGIEALNPIFVTLQIDESGKLRQTMDKDAVHIHTRDVLTGKERRAWNCPLASFV